MNAERLERAEMNRERRNLENAEGVGFEDVINYTDGHFATGEYTAGPSKGHKWLRGEGGAQIESEPLRISVASLENMPVAELRLGGWGAILAQGDNPKKPPTGEGWLTAHTSTELGFPQIHPDAELVLREGEERENDNQERPVYEVRRGSDGKLMVVRTTYFDGKGYKISTGKHVAGPEEGKVWEEARALGPEHEQPIASIVKTEHGAIRRLVVRGFSRTIAPGQKDIAAGRDIDPKALHLVMRGEWKANAPK